MNQIEITAVSFFSITDKWFIEINEMFEIAIDEQPAKELIKTFALVEVESRSEGRRYEHANNKPKPKYKTMTLRREINTTHYFIETEYGKTNGFVDLFYLSDYVKAREIEGTIVTIIE